MLEKLIKVLEKIDRKYFIKKKPNKKNWSIHKNSKNINKSDTIEAKKISSIYVSFLIKTTIVLIVMFVLSVLAGIIFLIVISAYYAQDLPSLEDEKIIEQTTKIYDREDNLLYEVHGDVNRTWIDIEKISPWVEKSTLALEDQGFYTHPGFDWKGLTRVVLTHGYNAMRYIIPGLPWKQTVGGSTITQQLVKNTILSNERTVKRKIQELLLARNIEQKYSKKEILELYLNNIPYGGSTYGIESASQKYFGISSTSLTPAQASVLASLPQSPTRLSPYGNNVDLLLERKDKALRQMFKLDMIDSDTYKEAIEEEIVFAPFIEKIKYPHFVQYVKEKLTALLTEKYSSEEAEFLLENGGLSVKTTVHPALQDLAEKSVKEGIEATSNYDVSNAALVAQDPKTGQILAMVGSIDFFDSENDGQVNVAIAKRQPGSSIKPIIYLQSFIEGYSPATVVYDVETDFGNDYKPNNYDLEFVGPVSFRNAMAQSRNVPAVKALFLAGIQDSIDLARRLGITTWGADAADRCGLSLVLGGCEVKLIDMVQAYSVIDNLGNKFEQSVLLEVKDADGEIIYKWEQPEAEKVLDEAVAYQLIDVMTDREARLPTFGSSLDVSRKAAVKTGTTNLYKDAWTIGFTPSITVGVWAGNNIPSSMKHGGSFVAGPIWRGFMNEAFKIKQFMAVEEWKRPSSIQEIEISTISGKLPSEFTPENKIKTEIFAPQNIPSEVEPDTMFKTAEICDTSGLLATEFCPDYLRTTLVYTYHHSIFPDRPNWEDPVLEWAKENAEKLNDDENGEPINKDLEDKKIKRVNSIDEFPVDFDNTFNSTSTEKSPYLSWASSRLDSLAIGTNVFKINIEAKNDLDKIQVYIDGESVFKRKFLKNSEQTTISIFIDPKKYPLESTHSINIFVHDVKQLRGLLKTQIVIKDDIIPPIIDNLLPRDKASISDGNIINISANITDNKNEVTRVELFIDGKPIKTFYKEPYEYQLSINDITAGNHTITFRAFDSSGNISKKSNDITIR